MLTESSVETRGTTTTDAVPSETLDRLLLDALVPSETSKVGAGEIENNLSSFETHRIRGIVRILALGGEDDARTRSGGAYDDGREDGGRTGGEKGFRSPFRDEFINFLRTNARASAISLSDATGPAARWHDARRGDFGGNALCR